MEKGIYPVKETAINGIQEVNLFVIRNSNRIVGTIILRHEQELGYSKANWNINLDYEDILVIYFYCTS